MSPNRVVQIHIPNNLSAAEKEDILINITLKRVPSDLLCEFMRKVVVNYSGGMSEAVKDLMRRAVEE